MSGLPDLPAFNEDTVHDETGASSPDSKAEATNTIDRIRAKSSGGSSSPKKGKSGSFGGSSYRKSSSFYGKEITVVSDGQGAQLAQQAHGRKQSVMLALQGGQIELFSGADKVDVSRRVMSRRATLCACLSRLFVCCLPSSQAAANEGQEVDQSAEVAKAVGQLHGRGDSLAAAANSEVNTDKAKLTHSPWLVGRSKRSLSGASKDGGKGGEGGGGGGGGGDSGRSSSSKGSQGDGASSRKASDSASAAKPAAAPAAPAAAVEMSSSPAAKPRAKSKSKRFDGPVY
eukprot:g2528.t1